MIYEDIFSVPIIQNLYKSYRVSFLGGKVEMQSHVRAKFRCRVGVGTYCLYSIKTFIPMESPRKPFKPTCVCVCVCVCVCFIRV